MGEYLLELQDLKTYFKVKAGKVRAVDGVSFAIKLGEKLGVVGESGCGKSVTALSIMRLLPHPPAENAGGSVLFEDQDLLDLPESAMRKIRGGKIGMIFQDPMTCLNPTMTVGKQIGEALRIHLNLSKDEGLKRAAALLEQVGIPAAAERINSYPHQFSGGMRQRVMIAIALACNPKLLIADEPTTALDVTVQAQILELINGVCSDFGTAVMLITHDLGVVASVPRLDEERHSQLKTIEGAPPDLLKPPPGCPFMPRCAFARAICRTMPPLDPIAGNAAHFKACWVDVNDPNEQAYAERRRQARIEKMLAATNGKAATALTASEEK